MDMAAFSLTALKNPPPVSMDFATVVVVAPNDPASIPDSDLPVSVDPNMAASQPAFSSHSDDILTFAALTSTVARKVYKAARKARSVTQLVLVDD